MTTKKSARPDEFILYLVKSTPVITKAKYARIEIPLDDVTILIRVNTELLYVSRETGEILNRNCIKFERTREMLALWDQESVIICNHLGLDCTFSLWNFRRGGKSTPVKHKSKHPIVLMNTLQLGCSDEKYVAVGMDIMEIHLMRVPSFEVILILSVPYDTGGLVHRILPLLDGNSMMCCCDSQLVRWYISSTEGDDKALFCSKHQPFEGLDGPVSDLLQMKHDPRKLIVCCEDDMDLDYSIWDIEKGTLIHKLPSIVYWSRLFEVGDSGLFVDFSFSLLRIWDLRGEGEGDLLFETKHKFESRMELRNGNLLNMYTSGGITYIEEYQLVR